MTFSIEQVLIELCCLSYSDTCPNDSISRQESAIADDIVVGLATAGMSSWKTCWGPTLSADEKRSYMAFIVTDGAGDYAVVIRGTDPCDVTEWIDDADAILVPAPYGNDVKIAQGVLIGIQAINELQDPNTQTTIAGFLQQQSIQNLYVTGHSFGGTHATALAPWMVEQGVTATVNVYAFASTSAGDANFSALYDNNSALTATLYYNDLDMVPYVWVELAEIESFYANVNGPACPTDVAALIDLIIALGLVSNYADISNQVALAGTVVPNLNWYQQVEAQHDHWLYASLLGSPLQTNEDLQLATRVARRKRRG